MDKIDFTLVDGDGADTMTQDEWEALVVAGIDAARDARKFIADKVAHLPMSLRADALIVATEALSGHLTFVHKQARDMAAMVVGDAAAQEAFELGEAKRAMIRESIGSADDAFDAWKNGGGRC